MSVGLRPFFQRLKSQITNQEYEDYKQGNPGKAIDKQGTGKCTKKKKKRNLGHLESEVCDILQVRTCKLHVVGFKSNLEDFDDCWCLRIVWNVVGTVSRN